MARQARLRLLFRDSSQQLHCSRIVRMHLLFHHLVPHFFFGDYCSDFPAGSEATPVQDGAPTPNETPSTATSANRQTDEDALKHKPPRKQARK
eukprot:m.90003 g.90003  ORF g.90003 m.90003 type:complete len:93 (-) comp51073_c0_seq2:2-280(-)